MGEETHGRSRKTRKVAPEGRPPPTQSRQTEADMVRAAHRGRMAMVERLQEPLAQQSLTPKQLRAVYALLDEVLADMHAQPPLEEENEAWH